MLKQIALIVASITVITIQAQNKVGGINSSASVNDKNPYSIGEIFVSNTNPNTNSSGIVGAYSTLLLKTTNGVLSIKGEDVTVFPNPTQSEITIQGKGLIFNKEIELYNLSGKLILKQKPINCQINLSEIPIGIYLLKISETKTIQISKN
jgi:hypothetical protein